MDVTSPTIIFSSGESRLPVLSLSPSLSLSLSCLSNVCMFTHSLTHSFCILILEVKWHGERKKGNTIDSHRIVIVFVCLLSTHSHFLSLSLSLSVSSHSLSISYLSSHSQWEFLSLSLISQREKFSSRDTSFELKVSTWFSIVRLIIHIGRKKWEEYSFVSKVWMNENSWSSLSLKSYFSLLFLPSSSLSHFSLSLSFPFLSPLPSFCSLRFSFLFFFCWKESNCKEQRRG